MTIREIKNSIKQMKRRQKQLREEKKWLNLELKTTSNCIKYYQIRLEQAKSEQQKTLF